MLIQALSAAQHLGTMQPLKFHLKIFRNFFHFKRPLNFEGTLIGSNGFLKAREFEPKTESIVKQLDLSERSTLNSLH
jgi:hypothetical protein